MTTDTDKCWACGKPYDAHVDARAPGEPVPRMPCGGLKAYFRPDIKVPPGSLAVSARLREAAHRALDAWLDRAEDEAVATIYEGRGGYIGRIKISAYAYDDTGTQLRIDTSFTQEIES